MPAPYIDSFFHPQRVCLNARRPQVRGEVSGDMGWLRWQGEYSETRLGRFWRVPKPTSISKGGYIDTNRFI